MPQVPILTGCHKRRLDVSRRLRMPMVWSVDGDQTWLLFPRHVVPPCDQVSRSLYLLPVNEHSLRAILAASPAHTNCTATVEAVLDVLRARARQHALDPSVATVIRTTPTATRFTLTKAQIGWLGCRGRILVLTGALNAAQIHTPTAWAKEQRGTSGPIQRGANFARCTLNSTCNLSVAPRFRCSGKTNCKV